MNLKAVLLSTFLLLPTASFAQQRVYTESYCYENTEEYVPGYYNNYGQYVGGHVKSDRRRVPCGYQSYQSQPQYHQPQYHRPQYHQQQVQPRRCTAARTTLGGLLGGGTAAALSKRDAYGWSIPLGAILGMGIAQAGCD